MNKIKGILATLGLCALLAALPASALSDPRLLDDTRFITSEELVGKTAEEVVKEIGPPARRETCVVSTPIGGQLVKTEGTGWLYRRIYERGLSQLFLCLVKDYVVAEQRSTVRIVKKGRDEKTFYELIDHRLLRNILDGDPERPEWIDPTGPEI